MDGSDAAGGFRMYGKHFAKCNDISWAAEQDRERCELFLMLIWET